jgi:hypothetical protein
MDRDVFFFLLLVGAAVVAVMFAADHYGLIDLEFQTSHKF